MDSLPTTEEITFSNGKRYTLKELSFGDIIDLEKAGFKLEELTATNSKGEIEVQKEAIGFVLWLLMREQVGVERERILWEPGFDEFSHSISFSDVVIHMPAITKFLQGLFTPKEEQETG